jgi:Family of unknown function (DUF6535)
MYSVEAVMPFKALNRPNMRAHVPSLNSSTSEFSTPKSYRSVYTVEMDEDIPLEMRERRKPPDTFARNPNNNTARAVTTDVRMNGEYIPGMVKESTVWDVYNNEARKVDNELVKDWTASLNFLLVFVSPLSLVAIKYSVLHRRQFSPPYSLHLLSRARRCWNRTRRKSLSTLRYNISIT